MSGYTGLTLAENSREFRDGQIPGCTQRQNSQPVRLTGSTQNGNQLIQDKIPSKTRAGDKPANRNAN